MAGEHTRAVLAPGTCYAAATMGQMVNSDTLGADSHAAPRGPRWRAGVGRADITVWRPGVGMMGWGMLHNYVERAATSLSARAFVLQDVASGERLAIVCCELAFISLALREAVVSRLAAQHPGLGLSLERVMLLATHTHSGPGGFTHYAFYNVTIPGFSQYVLDGLADGIVTAIVRAASGMAPARLGFDVGEFAPDVELAWNRAITSYNRNPEVTPVTEAEAHLAIDRKLRLLRIDRDDGEHLGSINWFAVHCTSVHSDNLALHFDNKGYAAATVEDALRGHGTAAPIAAFAQGAAGDVTPNRRRHPGRPWVRGEFADDDASARHNGGLQAQLALEVLARAATRAPLGPGLRVAHAFVDMSRVAIDPAFCGGRTDLHTGPAEIGMAMFFGTEEGPGLPRGVRGLQKWIARARPLLRRADAGDDPERARAQAEKVTWVESGRARLLGLRRLDRLPALPLRGRARGALAMFRALGDASPSPKPWTPQVLPIHLAVIGELALVAVPHEFTTVAGRRLCRTVAAALEAIGVREVVLAGYANAYAGYVTTPQEYELQDYEGASTHFGKWTLPAYQTVFARLAAELVRGGGDDAGIPRARPPEFTAAELEARAFAG